MSEADKELLPCPFCGGETKINESITPYAECCKCGAFGPDAIWPETPKGAWNTRADTAAAQVAAAYERGVRDAARHAASATGDVDLMNSILALLDNPTLDPDEPT